MKSLWRWFKLQPQLQAGIRDTMMGMYLMTCIQRRAWVLIFLGLIVISIHLSDTIVTSIKEKEGTS